MASVSNVIIPLSREAIAQIKSSVIITSLNQVVVELLKNSLDASSSKIEIALDYSRGNCSVEDNGVGIIPSEFETEGGLVKQYHSSKQHSPCSTHGSQGLFLYALSALSLLSMTSRHQLHSSHNSITFNRSQPILRQIPAPQNLHLAISNHGTRVIVRDLFGNMPVRVKQRALSQGDQHMVLKDWEDLRKAVTGVLLAWPTSVSVTILDIMSGRKIRLSASKKNIVESSCSEFGYARHAYSILSQVGLVSSSEPDSWIPVKASTSKASVTGMISVCPAPIKQTQFISLGIHPLSGRTGHNILFEEINRLFANSTFGNIDEQTDLDEAERKRRSKDRRYKNDLFTNRELRSSRKGIDRWPMFSINIEMLKHGSGKDFAADETLSDTGPLLTSIVELLRAVMVEFLRNHHFTTRTSLDEVQNPKVDSNDRTNYADSSRIALYSEGISSIEHWRMDHNTRTPSPFQQWSRIKSGRPSTKSKPTSSSSTPSHKSITLEPERKAKAKAKVAEQEAIPVISKSGIVTRPPFTDVAGLPSGHLAIGARASDDETVVWINPSTKERALINTRTGLVVPVSEEEKTRRSEVNCHLTVADVRKSIKTMNSEPSPWIRNVLNDWENPIFQPADISIPQVSFEASDMELQQLLHRCRHNCSQVEIERAFQNSTVSHSTRLSKEGLGQAEIISQVDKKFILVKMPSVGPVPEAESTINNRAILVLVDQHAADERCRLEDLLAELCTPEGTDLSGIKSEADQSGISTIRLEKPLTFDIPFSEMEILEKCHGHFSDWGIHFILPKNGSRLDTKQQYMVTVVALPPGIVERCKVEPRLLIELLRTESWKYEENRYKKNRQALSHKEGTNSRHSWLEMIHDCPQGIIDMLNSRACRSAIMFNDELSRLECQELLRRLRDCAFPFQCAHGRPSMIPLVDLFSLTQQSGHQDEVRCEDYKASFKAWKQELLNDTPQ